MEQRKDIPAFPNEGYARFEGMTLRQYAAIKLKVPNSGTDWLDDMIRESKRDDATLAAVPALIEKLNFIGLYRHTAPEDSDQLISAAKLIADAMLAAREK